MWLLRLYVSHDDNVSGEALIAVNEVFEKHRLSGCKLQVVDINSQREIAARDGVKRAPALIKVDPPPMRVIVPKRWDGVSVAAELELD